MKKKVVCFILVLALFPFLLTAGGAKEAAPVATVGVEESWEEIVRKAKEEGVVTVYSTTSRVSDAAKNFEAKYGIKVETHRLSEIEAISRLSQEGAAGVVGADLAILEDYPGLKMLLIEPGYVFNYIPPSAKVLAPDEQNPLVFAHVSRIIGYNTEKYSSDPLQSIWDLTTPQWKGKVMIRDVAITGEHQNFLTELVRRSDELEADYENRFGTKLVLREKNAGYEFIRRLIENDIILRDSDTTICEAVGKKGQADPPIGFIYVYSKHRDAEAKDLAVTYSDKVQPFGGYYYNQYIQQIKGQKHPYAARLFTEFLMTQEGFSAWAKDLGFYSSNETLQGYENDLPWSYWKTRLWTYDQQFAIENRSNILDVWIKNIR